jgi:cytochrome c-type biogenesis protein
MIVDPQTLTIPLAFMAGLLSFVSPCVLPLVPAYVGYLTGQATNTMSSSLAAAGAGSGAGMSGTAVRTQPNRWLVFLHGAFFVLGFSVVFILVFGFAVGFLGQLSNQFVSVRDTISRLGGLLVIVLGLHITGVIRIPFLYYDTRQQAPPRQDLGLFGSAIMGVTFAAGWSPCIGPILSSVLVLAGTSGSFDHSTALLTAYTLGLGAPFLIAALLIDKLSVQFRKLQAHMRKLEIASGLLMIVIGLLIFTGSLQRFSASLASFNNVTIALDQWLVGLSGGGGR